MRVAFCHSFTSKIPSILGGSSVRTAATVLVEITLLIPDTGAITNNKIRITAELRAESVNIFINFFRLNNVCLIKKYKKINLK
ncbi:hypothetical protein DSECCO2_590050 [anaerobic digester metagenome]